MYVCIRTICVGMYKQILSLMVYYVSIFLFCLTTPTSDSSMNISKRKQGNERTQETILAFKHHFTHFFLSYFVSYILET